MLQPVCHLTKNKYFTPRFGGSECGFPVCQEELAEFAVEPTCSPCGDDNLQEHFGELQRQSGLMQSLTWESCVEN